MYKYTSILCSLESQFFSTLQRNSSFILTRYCSTRELNAVAAEGATSDILLQNLRSSTDSVDVLHSVKKHHAIMNNRHIMQAFRSIFSLQKLDSSRLSNGEIIRSPPFAKLCKVLKNQARALDTNDLIDALKTFSYLGVPASSKIVQILLNLVTKQINELSLQQITFLDFLIKDFEPCPLVEALKIALPIVFEAQITIKMKGENVNQLADLLYYTTRNNMSESTVHLLVDNLIKNRMDIDLKSAKSIIRSVCDMKSCDEANRPLLHYCLDLVVAHSSRSTFHDIDVLLSKLVHRFSSKNYYFYNEDFLNFASKYVIDNDCGFDEGVWILRKASKFGHVCMPLLDYLSRKLEEDPNILENCGTLLLFSLVSGFALADHRPHNWHILEPIIIRNAIRHLTQIELPWVKFVQDLCTLDCWASDIIQVVFSPDFLEKYLARENNFLDHLQILKLYQALKLLCPLYDGPFPPVHVLDKAMALNGLNVTDYPLLPALGKGLGGNEYIHSGICTKYGHFIDHVVIFRKGAYPVAINQTLGQGKRVLLESFPATNETQIVGILYLPENSYCINTLKLKGAVRLMIKTLERCGVHVVAVSFHVWENLLDQEKIPYLMQAINEKIKQYQTELG